MVQLLAQSAPSATTVTALYTVPESSAIQNAKIIICNRGANDTIRISIRRTSIPLATEHYIAYDFSILAADVYSSLPEFAAGATNVIEVYSTGGTCTFALFGEATSG